MNPVRSDEPLFDEAFLAKIERLALAARRSEGAGTPRADRRGGRHEFADHRAYSPGDDLRFVDWHLYGRLGSLFLKEFAREEEASVVLLLDLSASMAGKLRGALRLSAALLTVALARGDRVRLATARDGDLRLSSTLAGDARRAELLDLLGACDGTAAGGTDLDASLARLAPDRGPGRRVLLVISDLLAARDGRRALAVHRGDVFVFHWLDEAERSPPASGRVRLVSVENGAENGAEEAYVGPAEAARYAAEFERWAEDLRRHLARGGVRYLLTPAERPVEDIVLTTLTAEGVLE
ncbi:MAG: DUF58 domain-containing protein [Planctomycetota bacterium]